MQRLRNPTTPIAGESGRGLFARAGGNHNIPHSWMILQHVGAIFRNRVRISENDGIDLAALGHIMKVDPNEFRSRTYPLISNRRRSFFGIELSDRCFETRVRRFSPAALEDSSHMRALWEIRDLPYCMEGWDLLQTHCRCLIKQGWTRITKVHCCDDCGQPLAERVEPIPVPLAYHAKLSLPALLLSPINEHHDRGRAMLPDQLAQQDRSAIYGTIVGIAEALAPIRRASNEQRVEAIHVAATVVAAWPHGINNISRPDYFCKIRWRRLLAKYNEMGVQEGSKLSVEEPSIELVGIRKAVAIGITSRNVLLLGREAGHFTKHVITLPGRGSFDAFDVAELKRFSREYSTRHSIHAVAKAMGLPIYAAEQIVASRRLPANGISLPGEESFISEADYKAFIGRLVLTGANTRAKGALSDFVPLRVACQAIGGRLKPWGAIFAAMLDGEICFAITSGDAPLMHRISIHISAAAALGRFTIDADETDDFPVSRTIHKQDALEILNISGDTPVLVGLPFSRHDGKLFELQTVLDRAAKTITLPEIAQRNGCSTSRAFHAMLKANVPLICEGCWCREAAEKHISS